MGEMEEKAIMYGLFLLDVYVSELTLNKEVYTDTGGAMLLAKVVFVNFPAMEVAERDRYHKNDENDLYVYKFNGGQTCHFSMPCEELVKRMKRVPLHIGIFREDDEFPICWVRTHLSGCACDLSKLMVKDPKPFMFRGPFELVDSGHSFAGQLGVDITIINMGRCLASNYALEPNCFIYKSNEGIEYKCNFTKETGTLHGLLGDNNFANIERHTMKLDTIPPNCLIRDMVGISPAANHLARGRPPPKPPREPLIDPALRTRKGRKGKKGKDKKK